MIWQRITIFKIEWPDLRWYPRDLNGALVYYMPESMKGKCVNYRMADHL